MAAIDALLERTKQLNASDLHLKVGMKPRFRIQGELIEVPGYEPLNFDDVNRLTREILTEDQDRFYQSEHELDFAYGDIHFGRFRANFFQEHRGPAAVFRRIPTQMPTLKGLNLPSVLETLVHMRSGLVLVTGPTGSGKTSTLAALIDIINNQYRKHIITLEDPIEFLHPSKKSVVHQRGLHYDMNDFASGILGALRQDPDIILIGEMRDLESIRLALTAAEVGSLIFATLHTNGAPQSIDRIIDVFSADEQPQIRTMLSQSLVAVVSQCLLRRIDAGGGRIPATEVMFANAAVANLIRENKVHEIRSVIQAGKGLGMHALDDSLLELVVKKIVEPEEAYSYADNKAAFEKFLPPPALTAK